MFKKLLLLWPRRAGKNSTTKLLRPNWRSEILDEIDLCKHNIFQAFQGEADGTLSKVDCANRVSDSVDKLVELGRLSVLQDFDAVCQVDVFMGFTNAEFAAVKKFFMFNKQITGWDK